MSNHLINQTSPYLLQHSDNPVDWYPWCTEAFQRARAEDKPVFLSIGYSTCHWCHVMAHESFENEYVARLLNKDFISIKVDKEERPDIDSIYMSVCQAFTGSGGWPTSIFMTPDQKPFFAGTYFPLKSRHGLISFPDLLITVSGKWRTDRESLLSSAMQILSALKHEEHSFAEAHAGNTKPSDQSVVLMDAAKAYYLHSFDSQNGGFGSAPKFPAPHNLWFLLTQFEKENDPRLLEMTEKTLIQMYRGGLFDHIGYGFCRYSTDPYFLAPHFEKMLYDNALLILAYSKAFQITGNPLYLTVAQKTAQYVEREMTGPDGGFYCAQDADVAGEEGKYYLFDPEEIKVVLGDDRGMCFNRHYDITPGGNFEGKSIPNLLQTPDYTESLDHLIPPLYEYRKRRYRLHRDDKMLTSWNALMIAALCCLYRVSKKGHYLTAAIRAQGFIEEQLCRGDTLFVSCREDRHGAEGFLDDYAYEIFALLSLYDATLHSAYLDRALQFCRKTSEDFFDGKNGGFYLYSEKQESLILRPKEIYDGAMPSGNSMMAYNLVRLCMLTTDEKLSQMKNLQLRFLSAKAAAYPGGQAMFLTALSDEVMPPQKTTVVLTGNETQQDIERLEIPLRILLPGIVVLLPRPTNEYPLKNNAVTYYICNNHGCLPPQNDI